MSRKTQGKGMSRGMSPELIEKETLVEKRGEVGLKNREPNLKSVPGLPRPNRRRPAKA